MKYEPILSAPEAQKPPAAEPEVSPANELKALEALEQMVASARTHYSRNHGEPNPSPAFPYEVVLSPANYAVLQSATKVVSQALRERAASTAPGWSAEAREALELAIVCQSCQGSGFFTFQCPSCEDGGGNCTCVPEACMECDGKKWSAPEPLAILVRRLLSDARIAEIEAAPPAPHKET